MEFAVDHRTPPLATAPSRAGGSTRQSDPTHDEALRAVLAELGERVKPVSLARERTMAVVAPFDQLLPDGLVRGQVVSCRGSAARSVAFGLVHDALAEGAWMAVVDVATFGIDAAAELGVPLERVVRVDTGLDEQDPPSATGLDWVEAMGAAIDGFDVVLTRVPVELQGERRPAAVRKLTSRLQRKGALVITLGAPGALGSDVDLEAYRTTWRGLGDGNGHLRRRVIDVRSGGRRVPSQRSCSIELTGEGTRVRIDPARVADGSFDRDPQADLLSEMADAVAVTDLSDRRLAG